MKQLLTAALLTSLPKQNIDIADSRLSGFMVRCRESGTASFMVCVARGRRVTIGRVNRVTLAEARSTAESILEGVRRETRRLLSEEPDICHYDAQARARVAIRARRGKRTGTFRQFLDDEETGYGRWVVANRKTGADTLATIRAQFAEFLDLPLEQLSAFAIERWRTDRLKDVTASTVNRNLAALRGALSRAVEWHRLRLHPMAAVKDSKVDRFGRVRFLEGAEELRLLAVLSERDRRRGHARDTGNTWRRARGYAERPTLGTYADHLTPIVVLALHTGCRQGELFGLQWGDVDFGRAQLTIRGAIAKSGRSRAIPLNATALDTLITWRPAPIVDGSACVFPGHDGAPLTDLKTAFTQVLRAAAIVGFRFHDLRHTFASKLVQAGVDLNTVRELLGHSDFKTTLRYAHLAPQHRAAAVAKLVNG